MEDPRVSVGAADTRGEADIDAEGEMEAVSRLERDGRALAEMDADAVGSAEAFPENEDVTVAKTAEAVARVD